jgi:zinc protease
MNYNIKITIRVSVLVLFSLFTLVTINAQNPSETPPPPGPAPSLSVPEVREMILPNGLKVVVVPRRNIPLVTVSLLVRAGSQTESDRKAGLANMTADLLTKGTQFRSATDIAEEIEFLGGSLNSGAGWDSSVVTINIMSDKLPKALAIMSDMVIRPVFPAQEIVLLKKQTIDSLNVNLKQPGTVLAYVSSRYSFGEHTNIGTPQTVKNIYRRDIISFHQENYLPENSVLIFTGDISEDQAFRYSKLFFNSWQKSKNNKKKEFSKTPEEATLTERPPVIGRMLVIDLPNSGQAAVGYSKKLEQGRIYCSNTGDCQSSFGYFPASVLNSVLGGGYSARLNQEIRLKRGLSYGARSGFDWRSLSSNFNANTQTKNESAAEVAELVKIEIDKLINEDVARDELIPRKAVVTGGFGRGLQTNNGLAARLRDIYLYGLKAGELNGYLEKVNQVTGQQIKSFASDNLAGGDMIIVGDSKLFMDDLKKRFPEQRIEIISAKDLDLNSDSLRKSKKSR